MTPQTHSFRRFARHWMSVGFALLILCGLGTSPQEAQSAAKPATTTFSSATLRDADAKDAGLPRPDNTSAKDWGG